MLQRDICVILSTGSQSTYWKETHCHNYDDCMIAIWNEKLGYVIVPRPRALKTASDATDRQDISYKCQNL